MLLQSYDLIVEQKPGTDNSNADGLSHQAEDAPSFEERGDVRIPTQDKNKTFSIDVVKCGYVHV